MRATRLMLEMIVDADGQLLSLYDGDARHRRASARNVFIRAMRLPS